MQSAQAGRSVLQEGDYEGAEAAFDIFENIVELAGFDMIYASTLHTEKFGSFAGQSIAKIAEQFGQDPYDTLYDILLEERCQVTMLDTIASEEDMLYFLKEQPGKY